MALGMFSGLKGLPKIARNMQGAPITKRDLPPIMPPAWLTQASERQGVDPALEWAAMNGADPAQQGLPGEMQPPAPGALPAARVNKKMAPQSGMLAPDPTEERGALAGLKTTAAAPAAQKAEGGPNWLDYIGLAGATLQEMGGITGAVGDFMGNRRTLGQEASMNSLLEGLDLTPEELGLVKAGMGRDVLAQRIDEQRSDKRYTRERGDTVADRREIRGYQVEDRDLGFKFDERKLDRTLNQDQSQFDATLGEDRRQFNATLGFNNKKLNADLAVEAAKLEADAAAGKQLGDAQLTTIYNNAQKFVDEQAAALNDLDQIAAESQAFQKTAKDFGSVGKSAGDSLGRFWSGITGGDISTLERHTRAISALMKKPGGGAWTDADQRVAESYVVNATNTREANAFAEQLAVARADRQRDYVEFLRENIDIYDPLSKQRAEALWGEYANANPMFDPETGQPNTQQLSFDEWIDKSVNEQTAQLDSGWQMFEGELAPDFRNIDELIGEFDTTFGQGAAREMMSRKWGADAVGQFFK